MEMRESYQLKLGGEVSYVLEDHVLLLDQLLSVHVSEAIDHDDL